MEFLAFPSRQPSHNIMDHSVGFIRILLYSLASVATRGAKRLVDTHITYCVHQVPDDDFLTLARFPESKPWPQNKLQKASMEENKPNHTCTTAPGARLACMLHSLCT